eukprot:1190467-Amorphochlora_amoeboformis.AAC.1
MSIDILSMTVAKGPLASANWIYITNRGQSHQTPRSAIANSNKLSTLGIVQDGVRPDDGEHRNTEFPHGGFGIGWGG